MLRPTRRCSSLASETWSCVASPRSSRTSLSCFTAHAPPPDHPSIPGPVAPPQTAAPASEPPDASHQLGKQSAREGILSSGSRFGPLSRLDRARNLLGLHPGDLGRVVARDAGGRHRDRISPHGPSAEVNRAAGRSACPTTGANGTGTCSVSAIPWASAIISAIPGPASGSTTSSPSGAGAPRPRACAHGDRSTAPAAGPAAGSASSVAAAACAHAAGSTATGNVNSVCGSGSGSSSTGTCSVQASASAASSTAPPRPPRPPAAPPTSARRRRRRGPRRAQPPRAPRAPRPRRRR